MHRLRPGHRRRLVPAVLVLALLAASCGSGESAQPDEPVAEDSPAAHTETSQGPASQVLALHALLPSSENLDPQWQSWPEPLFEMHPGCELIPPTASVKNRFAIVSDVSVLGNESGFGISYFEDEAEAEADLKWVNSELSDDCDVLMTPVTEDVVAASSGGTYSLDTDTTVGRELDVPAELAGFSAEAREYDVVYLATNEALDVKVLFYAVHVGHFTAWMRWVGPASDQPDPNLLAALVALGDDLNSLGSLDAFDATDQLGQRARAVSVVDVLPSRFDPFAPASLVLPEALGECATPDPTSAVFSLEGPSWNSFQGRTGERFEQSVLAFETSTEAEAFMDELKTDGLACLITAPIWPEPVFVNNVVDQWEESTMVGGEEVELVFLRSSASQAVADLEVEVEYTVGYVVREELVLGIEYGGLLGDGDSFMGDALVTMYEQAGS